MAKVRVYKLAKELGVQSALILELLDRMGHEVKSDLSTLDETTADDVRQRVTSAIEVEKKRLEERAQVERERAEEESRLQEEEDKKIAELEAAREVEVTEAEEKEPEPVEEPAEAPVPAPAPEAPEPEIPAAAAAAPPEAPEPEEKEAPAAVTPPAAVAATPAQPVQPEKPAQPAAPGKRAPRVFPAKRIPPLSALRPKPKAPPRPATPGGPPPGRPGRMRPGAVPGGAPPHAQAGPGARGRRRKKAKAKQQEIVQQPSTRRKTEQLPVPEKITLSEGVTVKELAEKLNRKSKDVIAKLIARGVLATINQPLNPDVAVEVAGEFGSTAKVLTFEEQAQQEAEPEIATIEGPEKEEAAPGVERPPVVTVMGHVDHGKTSLLDAIRKANVVAGESGGITQHIGAYQVETKGRKITFLDTPGHEAFTMMRARGAKATDIVVLVIGADDGVKPQTLEALDHSKAAGVPIVVAINKIDKPEAQPDRVKQQLADRDLLIEEYGGEVVSCEVSAKKKIGLDDLLEMILLQAEMEELRGTPDKPATGVILEAKLEKARGVIATVLVQDGTLKVGDPFIAGTAYGKVRAMTNENGDRVSEAGPSTPVEVMGLTGEPGAGDLLQALADEARARHIASFRQEKARQETLQRSARRTLESLAQEIAEGEVKELPILLKADVQGSIEALQQALSDLPSDRVRISILRAGTGAITQADVLLAAASDAVIVGFNVRPDRAAADLSRQEEVEIRTYSVIYDLINEIKQVMVGMLEPTFKETVLGQAEVRQLFKVPKIGMIAGCYVTDGKVTRSAEVRLLRENVVIYTGKVGSLRRFKDDVGEVKQGYECGIGIENFNDLKENDVIEFFVTERVAAETL